MFGPFVESWDWVKAHNPGSPFKKRHLSFITLHYLYLIALTIIGSIFLYPAGNMRYIDALFFSAGASTQSGLNTINVSSINTYQQVVLYLLPMIATPIFINTFVVFLRLYWFEKRFQHIVKEARNWRRTRSRSRTNTQILEESDTGRENRGVNGRSIVVLHDGQQQGSQPTFEIKSDKTHQETENNSGATLSAANEENSESRGQDQMSPSPNGGLQLPYSFHREITFADEVKEDRNLYSATRNIPQQLSTEQHIAFLENQRNPKDKASLRIPGPRDFDRGDVPQTVDEEENGDPLSKHVTSAEPVGHSENNSNETIDDLGKKQEEQQVKRNITIDAPDHPRLRPAKGGEPLSKFTSRRSGFSDKASHADSDKAPSTARPARLKHRTSTFGSLKSSASKEKDPMPYLSWQPTIGRNSAFVDLTEEQREELGGIEYRSLKSLALVLVAYYVGFHLLGVITLLPWIIRSRTWGPVVDSDGQSRAWWGIFTSASLFNDVGFTLTPDSFNSFETAVVPLFIGSFLIVIGNTGFPCMLRLVIWATSRFVPRDSGVWEEFKFLLDHPRRCFTLLFPSTATWWLFWILVVLNVIDLVFFIILDLNDPTVTTINPAGFRVLDGLFQAVSTRTAGFSVVNLANLHPAIQVSYLIMMYISVFPIAISVRRTNVYEEKSLGIYGSSSEDSEDEKEPSYVGAHLRRQLSFDLWYLFLGLFIVAIAEGSHLQNTNEYAFTMFSCLFEIVSAYGTVGLSLGYPNIDSSFSTEFSVVSKLVIIAMMLRGRHRGLPYELDRAILLPSESQNQKEDIDAARRMQRRNSSLSGNGPGANGLFRSRTAGTSGTATGHDRDGDAGANVETVEHRHSNPTKGGLGRVMAGLAAVPERAKEFREGESRKDT